MKKKAMGPLMGMKALLNIHHNIKDIIIHIHIAISHRHKE